MTTKKYIALTIGPIYKTLSNAKKTRELWAGSYIFSYIMKKIIFNLKNSGIKTFITPNITDDSIFNSGNEVGLFHDRFIFEITDSSNFDILKSVVNDVLENLGKEIYSHLKQKYVSINENEVKYFIKNYFSINFIEKELSDKDENDNEINPISELSKYLDTIELYNKPTPKSDNYLAKFLKISNGSFLVKDAFKERKLFIPSIPEIASIEISKNVDKEKIFGYKDDKEDADIYKQLKEEFKDKFKNYHKYIAIVHADGDSFTQILKSGSDLPTISKKLFEYAKSSHKLIEKYGGMTIYAGGDDLLFFAPVKNGDKIVFDLLDEISINFNNIFEAENEKIKKKNDEKKLANPIATVSFGLSISYYKFPLYEALEISRNLLFEKAKKEPKNNIAFQVIKHSGQSFGGILNKLENESNETIYTKFKNLIRETIQIEDSEIKFLGSYHHKFFSTYSIIEKIAKDKEKLQNYFNNYFNEDIHKKNRYFFDKMIEFIHEVFLSTYFVSNEERKDFIYAVLRLIKFIKGDEE